VAVGGRRRGRSEVQPSSSTGASYSSSSATPRSSGARVEEDRPHTGSRDDTLEDERADHPPVEAGTPVLGDEHGDTEQAPPQAGGQLCRDRIVRHRSPSGTRA
jgi:hypothetical protein